MGPRIAALLFALLPGAAFAQDTAWYEVVVADPVLAPGESTGVTIRGHFTPSLGGMIMVNGQPMGIASGLCDGLFDVATEPVAGTFSNPALAVPFNLQIGTNAGSIVPGGVDGVLWGEPFYFICPNPFPVNGGAIWSGTWTAGQVGQFTLSVATTSPFSVFANWHPPVSCGLPSVVQMPMDPAINASVTVTECYPDCDLSGGLTIADFSCFQGRYASGDPYADCNGSGGLTIADFGCFQSAFASGCP